MAIRLNTDRRTLALVALVVLIVAVSWLDVLDARMRHYVDQTVLQTGLLFASARAMNGIISLLQSAEVGVAVSINPGELLDPLNDTIEWFSDIMKFAVSSAIGQKIVLEILGTDIFKLGNTLAGLFLALYLLLDPGQNLLRGFFRIFLTFAFLRFALLAVMLSASLADAAFLDRRIQSDIQTIQAAEGNLTRAQRKQLEADSAQLETDIGALENQAAGLRAELPALQDRFRQDDAALNKIAEGMDLLDKINPMNKNPEYERLSRQRDVSRAALDRAMDELNRIERRIREKRNQIADNTEQLKDNGKAGLFSTLADRAAYLVEDMSIDRMEVQAREAMESMVNVVSALFIKIIVLPLLFFWAAIKIFKWLWHMDPREWVDRRHELTAALRGGNQALPNAGRPDAS